MRDDVVMKLLREVKAGKVSVEDARDALSDVELSEDAYQNAVDHGVFNEPEPGTIIRASISPSSDSWLVIIFAMWGYCGPYIGLEPFPTDCTIIGINSDYPSISQ